MAAITSTNKSHVSATSRPLYKSLEEKKGFLILSAQYSTVDFGVKEDIFIFPVI